jgi:hypothetical protein
MVVCCGERVNSQRRSRFFVLLVLHASDIFVTYTATKLPPN